MSSNADVFLGETRKLFEEVEAEKVAAGGTGGLAAKETAKMNFKLFMSAFVKDFPDEIKRDCQVQLKLIG